MLPPPRFRLPRQRKSADRFHVIKNLGEALAGLLARHLAAHRTRAVQESRATPLSIAQGKGPPKKNPEHAEGCQAKREERLAQYQQVVALRQQGFSQTAIAAQVGVSHATVSRWLRHGTFPEHKSPQRRTRLDPHLKAVAERWEAGCHNIVQLHRELVAAGHTLTYATSTGNSFVPCQKAGRRPDIPASFHALLCSRDKRCFSCFVAPPKLVAEDQETLALLRSLHRCQWIRYMSWFSSSPRCYVNAWESAWIVGWTR